MDINTLRNKYKSDTINMIDTQIQQDSFIKRFETNDGQIYVINPNNKKIENYTFQSNIFNQIGSHFSIDFIDNNKIIFHSNNLSLKDNTDILNECESYVVDFNDYVDFFNIFKSLDKKPIHTLSNILKNNDCNVTTTRIKFLSFPQFLNFKTMIDSYEMIEKSILVRTDTEKSLNLRMK